MTKKESELRERQITELCDTIAKLRHGVLQIQDHHIRLNLRAGRAVEESKTLSICNRILKESE